MLCFHKTKFRMIFAACFIITSISALDKATQMYDNAPKVVLQNMYGSIFAGKVIGEGKEIRVQFTLNIKNRSLEWARSSSVVLTTGAIREVDLLKLNYWHTITDNPILVKDIKFEDRLDIKLTWPIGSRFEAEPLPPFLAPTRERSLETFVRLGHGRFLKIIRGNVRINDDPDPCADIQQQEFLQAR